MLSRVAESMFWMSRYMERAENIARFILVNLNQSLDQPSEKRGNWWPIVVATGDDQEYLNQYGSFTSRDVIHFLAFDKKNRNSILSCLAAARENARSVRDRISAPMWEHITQSYFYARDGSGLESATTNPVEFFSTINVCGQQFGGITDATLCRGEAWHFGQLGRYLERADKTARLLNVKCIVLQPSHLATDSPVDSPDELHWLALLRSAGALEMYRQRHGSIHPHRVAELLTCDAGVPCSIRFSVQAANNSLHGISGTPIDQYVNSAEKQLGKLFSDLVFSDMSWILKVGLHEFLNDTVARLHAVGEHVHREFFAPQQWQQSPGASAVGGQPVAVSSPQTIVARPNISQLQAPNGSQTV